MATRTSLAAVLTILLFTSAGAMQTASAQPPKTPGVPYQEYEFPQAGKDLVFPRPKRVTAFIISRGLPAYESPRLEPALPFPIGHERMEKGGISAGSLVMYPQTKDAESSCPYLREKAEKAKSAPAKQDQLPATPLDNLKKLEEARKANQPASESKPASQQVMMSITITEVPRGRFLKEAPHIKVLKPAAQEKLLHRIMALRDANKAKVLAEPRMTTGSGRQASFFNGSEQAVPVATPTGATGVQFEEFGTRLTLRPHVLKDGKIRLEIEPEVSKADPASGTLIDGVTVPGRITQRIHTAAEMRSGDTLAVAGLPCTDTEKHAKEHETLFLVKAEIVEPEAMKEMELQRKLAAPVSANFVDVPLKKVLQDLQTWHGINIVPDKAALDEESLNLDEPISIRLDHVSLKSVLNLILRHAHMAYAVRDGVLVVTTEQGARGKPFMRTYPVADLLEVKPSMKCPLCGTQWSDTAESIIRMVQNSIGPRTWREAGGPGFIEYLPLANVLAVQQTPDVHEQIMDLLNALRRLKDASPSGDAEEAEPIPAPSSECDNPGLSSSLPPIDGGIVGAMQTLYLDHVEKEKAHLVLTVIESSSQPATPAGSPK